MSEQRAAASPRSLATSVLSDVLYTHRSLNATLDAALPNAGNARDARLVREMCYGVLRWLPRLEAVLRELLRKPLARKHADMHVLLLLGLYQLMYMRIPPYAAVSASVAVAGQRHKPWARGLINATLRRFLAEGDKFREISDADWEVRYAHPRWFIDRLRAARPESWRELLDANNQRAPMTLRVNARRMTREAYLCRLATAGIEASPTAHTTHGVSLARPLDVDRLPGFAGGEVSVQDGAAQLAVALLDLGEGATVLDACAAPGGKTAHILEQDVHLTRLVALDNDALRLERLQATLSRLGLGATLACADAATPATWWDGGPFDRILLDAPCSATGVIRRHPDVKWLRRNADLEGFARNQRALIDALWGLLAPGGLLLYATCSVLPMENDWQVRYILDAHRDAVERPIVSTWGRTAAHGRQILTGESDMDGFYYATIEKH